MARAAVVAGIGACLPRTAVDNDELVSWWASGTGSSPDTDAEWIKVRTGIEQRHVIAHGEATSDLAVQAGGRALASAGTTTAGAVVVATSTPDQLSPAIAPDVAARLGLGPVAAFDVNAVCTGFVYALATGAGLIAAEVTDSVLVIGADTFSTVLDPTDLTTRAVFGDGAGAVLLRAGTPDELGALAGVHLGSDGAHRTLIEIPGGGSRQRSTGLPVKEEDTFFRMQGRAVFAQAVNRMSESARHTVANVGWSVGEVDRWVLHQANARILTAVARGMQVPLDRFVTNIARVGNTVAASVPLALDAGLRSGALLAGHRVVLAGFGGGLTWGSVALVWPQLRPVPNGSVPNSSVPNSSGPNGSVPNGTAAPATRSDHTGGRG